jgi:hypothetical protein
MSDLIEAMAESLDEVLGEPASYELTGKIYAALKPHMEAALRETHHLVPKDQEPVGWIKSDGNGGWLTHSPYKTMHTDTPLYAIPEKRHG